MALLDLFIFILFFGCRLFGGLLRLLRSGRLLRKALFLGQKPVPGFRAVRRFRLFRLRFRFRHLGLRLRWCFVRGLLRCAVRRFSGRLFRIRMCRLVRLFLRQHLFGIQRFERQWLFVLCRHCGRFRFFRLRRFLRNGRHYRRRRFLRKRQTEIGEVQIVKIDLRQAGLRLGLGRRFLCSRLRILRRQGFLRLLFCSGFRQRLFRFRLALFGE